MPDLPEFSVPFENIHIISEKSTVADLAPLFGSQVLGFDTETCQFAEARKVNKGPHLIQLATESGHVFLIQVNRCTHLLTEIKDLFESDKVIKVGFAIDGDLPEIKNKLGWSFANVVDISLSFKKSRKHQPGLKSCVATALDQNLLKPHNMWKKNWAIKNLSPAQIQYAASDAMAALKLYFKQTAAKEE